MKLESDPPVLHPTALQIPNPKPLKHGNNIVDPTRLNAAKKITGEKQDVFLCEVKGSDLIAASLPSEHNDEYGFWPVLDFECPFPSEDLAEGKGSEMIKAIREDLLGETVSLKRDLDMITEEEAKGFELPKVIICCKDDSDYYETRDICVDKVVIPDEKILFETNTARLADEETDSSLMRERSEICHPISDAYEVPEDCCHVDPVGRCPDHSVDSAEKLVTEDLQHDSSAAHVNEAEKQSDEVLHDTSTAGSTSTLHAGEEMKERHEDATKDCDTASVKSTSPENSEVEMVIDEKEAVSSEPELPFRSEVQTGTITFSFTASTPAPSSRYENHCKGDRELLDSQGSPQLDEGHPHFVQDQHSHGESSFSVLAAPPSGLLSHSDPLAYVGSLSLRSDSSTGTSTRSFAFPVLQSEWSSSPVRMAKADRRLYRKNSGWRRRLLCCKF